MLALPPAAFPSCLLCAWGGGGVQERDCEAWVGTCLSTVYWLTGAQVCFTVCSALFLLPFLLLWKLKHPAETSKEE